MTAESTFALYDPKTDLTFDRRLLGVWLPDTVCVNLRRGEGKTYLAGPGWIICGLSSLAMPATNRSRRTRFIS